MYENDNEIVGGGKDRNEKDEHGHEVKGCEQNWIDVYGDEDENKVWNANMRKRDRFENEVEIREVWMKMG